MAASLKKTSKGRQKLPMKKMENESNLQVTFSKRRSGLFKKANELSTLCGAQVCMIVFSPAGKAYSFGNPNVETLIQRFRNGSPTAAIPMDAAQRIADARRATRVRKLNAELSELNDKLQAVKKRVNELNHQLPPQQWWAGPLEHMSVPQIKHLKATFEQMQKIVTRLISEKIDLQSAIHDVNASTPHSAPAPAPTPRANSSSSSHVVVTVAGGNYYVPQRNWFNQHNTTALLQNERRFDDRNINVVNPVYYAGYTDMLLGGGYGPYGGPNGFY